MSLLATTDTTAQPSSRPSDEIVVGYDGTSESRHALTWALDEASRRNVACRVVQVLPPVATALTSSSVQAGWLVALLATTGREVRTAVRDAGIGIVRPAPRVEVDARVGPPALTLVEAAESATLLVVGSRGHGRVGHLVLGSVASHAIAYARCPVVVLGPRALAAENATRDS